MNNESFDVLVVGSGGGALVARAAAARGLRTALLERDACGGTCLNRGCIPSKALIVPCELAARLRRAPALNLRLPGPPTVDFPALVRRTSATIDAYSQRLETTFRQTPNLELVRGEARFTGPRTFTVAGRTLTAPLVFVASGSRPRLPPIAGLAGTPYMTSREALRRESLPARLLVVGGGYIAVELGFVYAAAGARVTFLVRSRLLRREDPEIAAEFARAFGRHHDVRTGVAIRSVRHAGGLFAVTLDDTAGRSAPLEAEALLVAAGVEPDTAALDLDRAGIRSNAEGFIRVNDCLETSAPGVYAFGDVIGRHLYRHTANHEARYLVRRTLDRATDAPLDYGPVPHAVFSDPEVAGVGPTEPQARAAGLEIVVGRARFAESTPGEARGLEDGLCKLIFDRPSRRLISAHLVGQDAATLLQGLVLAMTHGATLETLLDTIVIHPALPEILADAWHDARDRWDAR